MVKWWGAMMLAAAMAAPAMAEEARTDTYTMSAERRDVALTGNTSGKKRPAQQVIVTVTRNDGAPAGDAAQAVAARLACGGAKPLVAFPVAAPRGAKAYEFLCPRG